MHTALDGQKKEEALATLDHLLAEIGRLQNGSSPLLQEHLQSARAYLLGAMPDEYEFSLAAAKESTAELADASKQSLVKREIDVLLQDAEQAAARGDVKSHQHQAPPQSKRVDDPSKSELYKFFQGSKTTMGVFYPTHYIFAAFPSYQAATKAADKLGEIGFQGDEVVAVTSAETQRFFNEMRADVGIWGELMSRISRFFGTEEVFADTDIRRSKEGAGFLAVYCPREEEAERVRDLLEPFEPMSIQLYLPSGVRSLEKSPGPRGRGPEQD